MIPGLEWLAGALGEIALEKGIGGLRAKLKDGAARRELVQACKAAVEAAARTAPELHESLSSQSFLEDSILPIVRDLLDDPSRLGSAELLADTYADRFVVRFSEGSGVDQTLERIFRTDRPTLVAAFRAFLRTLKSELYHSSKWSEVQHHRTTELMAVRIEALADAIIGKHAASGPVIDPVAARADAATASAELLEWPTDIAGIRFETPTLAALVKHITERPTGTTLLIGEAGSGKSALLSRLAQVLDGQGITAFAIKADLLPDDVKSVADIGKALEIGGDLEATLVALAGERPVVLIIDQLDAVSDVMDRRSARMRLLLRLMKAISTRSRTGALPFPIHIIASSRPFEAAHDARFQQLDAFPQYMHLLSSAQIDEMLTHLRVASSELNPGLLKTLARPFALKLFAQLVQRGSPVNNLTESQLLDKWLIAADLGDRNERQACTTMLSELAKEMVTTETLWRPADRYDIEHSDAMRRCEACGLIVRTHEKISFSHQSWLDDFQAKSFTSADLLVQYAWEKQDSLFVRASILRGLQRQRAYDQASYERSISTLLKGETTRRHLKHLIVDIISTDPAPLPTEMAWVEKFLATDRALAWRALQRLSSHWPAWRDRFRLHLPGMMQHDDFRWHAARLLALEVAHDPLFVESIVDRNWRAPSERKLALRVLEQSNYPLELSNHWLSAPFDPVEMDEHELPHLVSSLREEGHIDLAVDLVGRWANGQPTGRDHHPKLYDLEHLAERAPAELAAALLPWFQGVAAAEVQPGHPGYLRLRSSKSLPWDWDFSSETGSAFQALLAAVAATAAANPVSAWQMLEPLTGIDIDEIQQLVAVGLIAAGQSLAPQILSYLLGDARRFSISEVHVDGDDGVSRTIPGWYSQELIATIVPALSAHELAELRDSIERWSPYELSALEAAPGDVRRFMKWADDARLPLLERLPADAVPARRLRQIKEWRAVQPKSRGRPNLLGTAMLIEAPMSAEEMELASDADIRSLIDELPDGSPDTMHRFSARRPGRNGGVRQLGQAFAAFGKKHPDRAMDIARKYFEPGRHESVAGDLVMTVSDLESAPTETCLQLILDLSERGFSSKGWRQDASRALENIARRAEGLDDAVIEMLDAWMERDPTVIAAQIQSRQAADNSNEMAEARRTSNPAPVMFTGGGFATLPHHNYPMLSAIADGLLRRRPSEQEAWLAILERHLADPEDPQIWSSILARYGAYVWSPEAARVSGLFDSLWQICPGAFQGARIAGFLWAMRDRLSEELISGVLATWLTSGNIRMVQSAGEFIAAAYFVEPESNLYRRLYFALDEAAPAARLGVLFSAATCWREAEPAIRARAHEAIMLSASGADGANAVAISTAIDGRSTPLPDALTKQMLGAFANNTDLLHAALGRRFAHVLQELLVHPDFDESVMEVLESATTLGIGSPRRTRLDLAGSDLVGIAIALQQNDGALRARAMSAYEIMLDADVRGAEEAATASLGR